MSHWAAVVVIGRSAGLSRDHRGAVGAIGAQWDPWGSVGGESVGLTSGHWGVTGAQ